MKVGEKDMGSSADNNGKKVEGDSTGLVGIITSHDNSHDNSKTNTLVSVPANGLLYRGVDYSLATILPPTYQRLYPSLEDALSRHVSLVEAAYKIGGDEHRNDKRLSGEPYFSGHVVPVTKVTHYLTKYLSSDQQDVAMALGLIHDVTEKRGKYTIEFIATTLDPLSNGMPLSKFVAMVDKKNNGNTEEKAIEHGLQNKIVGAVLVADKWHNIVTSIYLEPKRREKFFSNIDSYILIAKVHGFNEVADDLKKLKSNYYRGDQLDIHHLNLYSHVADHLNHGGTERINAAINKHNFI